jgi:molybdopterin/thiamine biosynthesis adenylyltransferase
MRSTFSKSSIHPVVYRTKHLRPRTKDEESVDDRQQKVPGYKPGAYANAKVVLIGGGGINSLVGLVLVRKGLGSLMILDFDIVGLSNLPRQFFYEEDLDKLKAHCLAANLAKEGFLGSTIAAYNLSFQDAVDKGIDLNGSVAVVGVDNNPCRVFASEYYRKQAIPVIFIAVSRNADHGYVFVQHPGGACFGCMFPDALDDNTFPCGTPAVIDILTVVAGLASYAIDSLLMPRKRFWNYRDVFLDGSIPGNTWRVEKREDCKLCGAGQGAGRQ